MQPPWHFVCTPDFSPTDVRFVALVRDRQVAPPKPQVAAAPDRILLALFLQWQDHSVVKRKQEGLAAHVCFVALLPGEHVGRKPSKTPALVGLRDQQDGPSDAPLKEVVGEELVFGGLELQSQLALEGQHRLDPFYLRDADRFPQLLDLHQDRLVQEDALRQEALLAELLHLLLLLLDLLADGVAQLHADRRLQVGQQRRIPNFVLVAPVELCSGPAEEFAIDQVEHAIFLPVEDFLQDGNVFVIVLGDAVFDGLAVSDFPGCQRLGVLELLVFEDGVSLVLVGATSHIADVSVTEARVVAADMRYSSLMFLAALSLGP